MIAAELERIRAIPWRDMQPIALCIAPRRQGRRALVLAALDAHSWRTAIEIAGRTGLSENHVRHSLRELNASGLLQRSGKRGEGGWRWRRA
jgi:predicted ArsR family transcriptional regulator